MTACIRVEYADMLELLDEIEQYVRADEIFPYGFFLIDSGHLDWLSQLPCPCFTRLVQNGLMRSRHVDKWRSRMSQVRIWA